MKKYLFFTLLAFALVCASLFVVVAQDAAPVQDTVEMVATDAGAALDTSYELPPVGASPWVWFKWLIAIVGLSTLRAILFRLIPSTANIDWINKIFQLLNWLLGAWAPNRKSGGGTH